MDWWVLPEKASSAYVQRHGGIPLQHPTDDYERDSLGFQYMGPEWRYCIILNLVFSRKTTFQLICDRWCVLKSSQGHTWNIQWLTKTDWPVCTLWVCWRPVWLLRWSWRSCVARVHQSQPSLSSTSRSHSLTPGVWHRWIYINRININRINHF